ncbi:tRNA (guanine-N(1)-)-methyltransferase [Alicyclobacillus sacchari]|nr:tRNA (guanine-N(1)-)-methyltransferase [Alicyclobacillus sacchari]
MALAIHVLTLFPNMFSGVLGESMMKRAVEIGAVEIELIDFRQYAKDRHRTVDDTPYGGGAGMLLKPEPLFDAIDDLRNRLHPRLEPPRERVVLLSPSGRRFTQQVAEEYAQSNRIVLVCGHYEGFDDRVRQALATEELSLGDFVMTGGEIAAMAVIDAVTRLLPGVLGNAASLADESHVQGLLEYPQFTRPLSIEGWRYPRFWSRATISGSSNGESGTLCIGRGNIGPICCSMSILLHANGHG